jgi:serine/threonine protein kinase/Tol biopolymer transport system component
MSLDSGTRLGPYEVVALIGSGGMGDVYRARDTRLHRDVAIKVLPPGVADNPTRRARFQREAQAISRLSHPNICAIYDIGEHDGVAFLVMEYIEGESVEQRLRPGPLPWTAAVQTAIQIAAAIDVAHDHGIVHRDLKPANVMLAGSGVKLLDFGIAKLLDEVAGEAASPLTPTASLTAEHKVVGTLNYMAPEQLEGREVDARTDVFALGAVLYEMLTGRKAFDGSSAASVTAAVLTVEPPSMSSTGTSEVIVPPALDHVVRRALAKNRDERWQTARDVMHELRWILEGPPREVVRPSLPLGPQRHGLALAIGAVAIAVTGASIGWFGRPAQSGKSEPLTIFPIGAPEGTTLGSGYGGFAVSPDGLKIAFVARTTETSSIWVRYLNDPNPHRLLGTEGGTGPFWSPDSQWVAFHADGSTRIKRIDISGGQPSVVAEVKSEGPLSNTTAACWMPDNTIVFAQSGALFRVPVTGGDPVLVAAPDAARNESAYLLPSPLAGGQFLYAVRRNQAEITESQIRGGSDGRTASLTSVQSNAVLAAGYLIFRQGSALVAQRFDQSAHRLNGQPVLLADSVDYNPGNARTAFSASADVLAYRPETSHQLAWFDRGGRRVGSIGEVGHDWNPAVAHDGSSVAFDRFDPTRPRFHIWTIDDQGRATELTHGVTNRFPVWSWDGQWIAYGTPAAVGKEIRRTRASGRGEDEMLFRTERDLAIPLDWSRDGAFLIYEMAGDVWALSLKDRTPHQLTRTGTAEKTARLSADGKWLAYTLIDHGARSIWIQAFPEGSVPQRVPAEEGFDPSWRQDGQELYYITSAGALMMVPVNSGATLTFGTPVRLFAVERGAHIPLHVFAAAPDGQRFLVSEPVQRETSITVVVHWTSLVRQ